MKKSITTKEKSLMVYLATGVAVATLTSCVTEKCAGPCPQGGHLPLIACQPIDAAADVDAKESATFSVKAVGKNLTYQWFAKRVKDTDFGPINSATASSYTINPVTAADYGLYYCMVMSDDYHGSFTASRSASLGGVPNGAAGPFVPIDNPVTAGTISTICGHAVSGHWDQFPGTETPPSGKTGVNCQIWNISASPNVVIPTTDYYLQYWVTAVNTGCMTPIAGNWVTHSVTAGLHYKFIAHFVNPPPDGTVLELQGVWTP